MKETSEGLHPKDCIVARWFENNCLNKTDKESPTCSKDNLWTMLADNAWNNWHLRSIDIKTAFFQGEKLTWNVFIKLPLESNCSPEPTWNIKKCVYGVTSKINPSLFIWCNTKQEVVGLMAINVDDFLCTGDNDFTESLISKLQYNFVLGKIFGTEYKTEGNIITFVQKSYVDNLTKTDIDINQRKNSTFDYTQKRNSTIKSWSTFMAV